MAPTISLALCMRASFARAKLSLSLALLCSSVLMIRLAATHSTCQSRDLNTGNPEAEFAARARIRWPDGSRKNTGSHGCSDVLAKTNERW